MKLVCTGHEFACNCLRMAMSGTKIYHGLLALFTSYSHQALPFNYYSQNKIVNILVFQLAAFSPQNIAGLDDSLDTEDNLNHSQDRFR